MRTPIYLDYSATTPIDFRVADKMNENMTFNGNFGNPSSRSHFFGWKAEEAVNIARNQIAELIHSDPREIIFTSGATESNNLAIKGVANFYKKKGMHIITSKIEHKSVLDSCLYLELLGFKITYLSPDKDGVLDLLELESNIKKDTILVSIMYVNNEIGIIQDIRKISEICSNYSVLFHVDATQAVGKLEINLSKLNIDLMSFSAHKIYGPKGIGVLYVNKRRRPRIRIEAQQHGGGHERGMRSGTLPVHQIVGMGEACKILKKEMSVEILKINFLRDLFLNKIKKIEEIYLNGNIEKSVPHILNISFNFIEGESLIMSLKDLAISSGSACTSSSLEPSYVLKALGVGDELAHSSIRFSFGRFTTQKDIEYSVKIISAAVERLRDLSPLWEMYKQGVDFNSINWKSS